MSIIKVLLTNKIIRAIIIFLGAGYIISPIDLMPEAILKHFGLFDDVIVLVYLYYFIKRNPKKIKDFQKENSRENTKEEIKTENKKLSPYKILGIEHDANEKEIKTAYKKLISQYHPDKVEHLGDELKNKAMEKTLEIKKAYDILMKS